MEHASRRHQGMAHEGGDDHEDPKKSRRMYRRFGATLLASLLVMYLLAFSQLDLFAHFQLSLSVLWISLSMVSAMGIIMLIGMRSMLNDRRLNIILLVAFGLILLGAFTAGRVEAFVGDDAFLRSMIPHHSRAIHMCQEAALSDPEVIQLCGEIIEAQREEIAQMEQIMARRSG